MRAEERCGFLYASSAAERGCSSVVERMLCMYEAPGSIPGISTVSYLFLPKSCHTVGRPSREGDRQPAGLIRELSGREHRQQTSLGLIPDTGLDHCRVVSRGVARSPRTCILELTLPVIRAVTPLGKQRTSKEGFATDHPFG